MNHRCDGRNAPEMLALNFRENERLIHEKRRAKRLMEP